MPYVLWVAAFNNAQIFLFCLLETLFFPSVHKATDRASEAERSAFATSRLMTAFNKNGLGIFLVANLLTGVVNMSVNTLDANTWQAMAILIAYSAVVSGIALAMDAFNFKLKL
jgi:phosphatidylinositol glycan class W